MEKAIESLLAKLIKMEKKATKLETEAEDLKNHIRLRNDTPEFFGHSQEYTYKEMERVYECIYYAKDNILTAERIIRQLRQ